MILPRSAFRRRQRTRPPLTLLRERLLHIDRELVRAADPDPWLSRAAALTRAADPDPAHGRRVAVLAARLAVAVGWTCERAAQLRHAAELHDIGKHALPRALLLHPGALSPGQREQLVLHTQAAAWLLGGLRHPVLQLAMTVGHGHHERWDGGGYPDRLARSDIPLAARLVAACDVWDALTHPRPYRPALSAEQAAEVVGGMAGTGLDPDLTAALLDLTCECPISRASAT